MKYLKYLFLLLLINMLLYFPIQHLVELGCLYEENNYRHLELDWGVHTLGIFYYLVIFFPIFEEFSFRLFLNPKQKNLQIGISFLCILVLYKILDQAFDFSSYRFLITTGTIVVALLLSKLFDEKFHKESEWLLKVKKIYLLVISSIFFAFMHYGVNYSSDLFFISLIPLTKHFFSGLIIGIFRIGHGFSSGIILHSMNNFFAFLIIFLN